MRKEMFDFDLQLFGGGGDGKSGGKLLGTLVFGALGFIYAGALFGAKCWGGAMLGASLFSSVWTATHKPNFSGTSNNSIPSIQRFDKAQETISNQDSIPVVYGKRLVTGNQTYHETNADLTQLHKHVVLCEGGINGIVSITANGLLVPTGQQTKNTVFTIQNLQDEAAYVSISDKHLHLVGGGIDKTLYLANKSDFESGDADTFWEYQVNISSLVSYINRLGHGWECFPVASTNKYPGDIYTASGNCYRRPINFETGTVTGGTSYTFHDCEAPDIYEQTGGYPNMAWLDMKFFSSSELNGNPSVECVIEGRKLYDMRTGETKYSTNPSLCVWDFLTNKRYGLGKWITEEDLDEDSFIESANYCDEMICFTNSDGSQEMAKRYELNMIINERQDALTWLQAMLANFSGFLVYSQGKLKLCIEKPSPVRYKFDDSNINDLQIAPLKLSETPNKYSVSLIDPLNNWKIINAIVEDFADQKQRGVIVEKEIELEGVTSQHQALRLARFYRDYNFVCPIQLSFTTGIEAMHLEPGDVVTVTYRNVFTNLPIRIAEIKETEDNKFEISGRQYNESIYSDDLGGGIHWYNYTSTNDTEYDGLPPKNVSNLTVSSNYTCINGTYEYVINGVFNLPSNAVSADIYYKNSSAIAENINVSDLELPADELGYGTSNWICAGESTHDFRITNVDVGNTYIVKVVAKNEKGVCASKPPEVYIKISERALVTSQPCNFKLDYSTGKLTFSWNDVADSDAMYYEVRMNTAVGSVDGMIGRTNSTYLITNSLPRKGTAYVYAVNNQKRYGEPAKTKWHIPYPPVPIIKWRETVRGAAISISNYSNAYNGVKWSIVGTTTDYNKTFTTETGVFQLNSEPDIYEVSATMIDVIGEGITSDKVNVTIKATFDAEWITDGSITADKIDSSINDSLQKADESVQAIKDSIGKAEEDLNAVKKELETTVADSIAEIKKTTDSISSTVASNKSNSDAAISNVKQTAEGIIANLGKAPDAKGQYAAITSLKATADSLSSTIASNKSSTDSEISSIKQTASGLASTVSKNKETSDGQIKSLTSSVNQNANSITALVTNLSDKDKAIKNYSALSLLNDAINLKVSKDGVISAINMSSEGTTIDGKHLHVTGDTKFDKNVIVGGMISAGAITADKLSSDVITLKDKQGISGGSVTLDSKGMSCSNSNGTSVVFNESGMSFKDSNGNTFSSIGRMIIGYAHDGQRVKFSNTWDSVPYVMVAASDLQTNAPGYETTRINQLTRAYDISSSGFSIMCRSILQSGSGSVGSRTICSGINVSGSYSIDLPPDVSKIEFYVELFSQRGRTSSTYGFFEFCTGAWFWVTVNGQQVASNSVKGYCDTFKVSLDIEPGSTVAVHGATGEENGGGDCAAYVKLQGGNFLSQDDVVIAKGDCIFIAIDRSNSLFSVDNLE